MKSPTILLSVASWTESDGNPFAIAQTLPSARSALRLGLGLIGPAYDYCGLC